MRRLAFGLAFLGFTSIARAQSVPLLSVELTAGHGTSTVHTSHTYYGFTQPALLRAALTLRLGTAGRIRPIVTVEHSSSCPFIACGESAVCALAPDGSCRVSLAEPDGNAIAAGLAGTLGRFALIQLTAGAGDYWKQARYIDANISLEPISHLGFVAGARHIVGRDVRGDRVWFFPVSFGLRVH